MSTEPDGRGESPPSNRKSAPPSVTRTIHCVMCGGHGHVIRMNPEWLRYMRGRAGITLRAMAKRLGVSPAYVCDVEKGRRAVPDAWRAEYAKAAHGTRR